ncbi:NifU-like protein 4, mitochondrial [Vanrija albida]|uniref:NifU-like protein 4, mitochondrial n=1 Tax=Vanrija albida TaxID=181172 RepID=A0ABR3PYW9_9TREE
MRSSIASSSRAVLATARPATRPLARGLASSARAAARVPPAAGVGLARGVNLGRGGMPRLAGARQQARTMFIQTETTPNEASLKFIPGVDVTNGATHEFLDLRSALPSPLATRLLTIDGVVGVFFGPDFVTCSKDESYAWSILKPEVFAVLMEHFSSGAPLFKDGQAADGPEDTRILDTDSEIVGMIKELLETRVRPAIMEDGGDIEYKGFDEETGIVQLKLKGSCRGCSSSSVTLKNGIERMLMHYVPEVQSVEQFIDEEERIALDEFNKLEARLSKKKDTSHDDKQKISDYLSA